MQLLLKTNANFSRFYCNKNLPYSSGSMYYSYIWGIIKKKYVLFSRKMQKV